MKQSNKLINRLTNKLAVSALLLLFLLLLTTPTLFAAGAKLFLSPSSGSYYVGSYFSVEVRVNTGGNSTNAYKAVLAYPAEKLSAVSVSSGGSICTLWIPPTPSYSNNAGSAAFECGATTAYKGPVGRIGTVTFVAKAAGSYTVSISGGNVKKADGSGTEILSVRESASFAIQDLPEGVPAVSSPTHPDQNAWYKEKTVSLSWTAPSAADGYSYIFNSNPEETPDDLAEGNETSRTYENNGDGTWYFHLKARSGSNWSTTNHFRVQIDSRPPEDFEIVVDPPGERITRAPLLSFAATDTLSGIDHYEISIDGSTPLTTTSPYQFERIKGGTHEIIVQAVDRAGNIKEARATLEVVGISAPVITQPIEGETIPFLAPLDIRAGTGSAGTIELLLDGKIVATPNTDAGFKIEYTLRQLILPGGHKLTAVFINADGIESAPAEVSFKVNAGTVYLLGLLIPGFIFFPVALIIIALLMFFLVRRIKRWKNKRRGGKQVDQLTG